MKSSRTKGQPRHACRCPVKSCRAVSRVLRTTSESGAVVRKRICTNGHQFVTKETPNVDAKRRRTPKARVANKTRKLRKNGSPRRRASRVRRAATSD